MNYYNLCHLNHIDNLSKIKKEFFFKNKVKFERFKKKSLSSLYFILQNKSEYLRKIKNKKLANTISKFQLSNYNIFKEKTLTGHNKNITCLLKYNNNKLISGSNDCSIRIWDLIGGKSLLTLIGHTQSITCLSVFALNQSNTSHLASGSEDFLIKIWDLQNGNCLTSLAGHSYIINGVVIVNDQNNTLMNKMNKLLISGCKNGYIKIWDLDSNSCIKSLRDNIKFVCIINHSNKYIICGSTRGSIDIIYIIHNYSVSTLSLNFPYVESYINKLSLNQFVSMGNDRKIKIWDIENRTCIKIYFIVFDNIRNSYIYYSGLRWKLLVGTYLKTKIFDLNTGEQLKKIKHGRNGIKKIKNEYVIIVNINQYQVAFGLHGGDIVISDIYK